MLCEGFTAKLEEYRERYQDILTHWVVPFPYKLNKMLFFKMQDKK